MALKTSLFAGAAALSLSSIALAATPDVNVSYEQFTLSNGLRVVVHEDRKAPIVAVSIWYHVGSKDEPAGKTGFAHLFEHLMFNGSENHPGEFFEPFEQVGATGMNGTTWLDRTNYFETVPTPALDMALWMESDRMGHLLGAIDQDTLDEQRGVVQNEKRQGDNNPYGMAQYRLQYGVFPKGHPYHHTTIGSMADLDAAALGDVKNWFKEYYGAANTVLVLAGDIDAKTAKAKVEKYFGDIKAGPSLPHLKSWVPVKSENVLETITDQVPQARLYRQWAVPGRTTKDKTMLDLAASVLGSGKNSRLFKELVYEREIATQVNVYVEDHELASIFSIEVTAKPGSDLTEIENVVNRISADFIANGPTKEELKRAQTKINAGAVRGLERIGGFGGKAVTLAEGALYAGDPGFYKTRLNWINEANTSAVKNAFRNWVGKPYYQLNVMPFGKHETAKSTVDRSKGLPAVGALPDLSFPVVREATLKNGMKLVFAERHAVPVINVALQFDAGYASDQGGKLGTSSFAMALLDEGAGKMSALALNEKLESLGAQLNTGSSLDTSTVTLSALKENLAPSLNIMADVVMRPTFSDEEIERTRKRWIANIAREKSQPVQLALRLLPPALYGKDHAYGVPFTGSGTVKSIQSLSRNDLVAFKDNWLRSDNATLFVVGDTTLEAILPELNRVFGNWKAPSDPKPVKNIGMVSLPKTGKVVLIDKKHSPQTLILAGEVTPAGTSPDALTIDAMNGILGGQFTARVNMNLREDKHWAYGAYTFLQGAKGQRPWLVYAPVQTDKTSESLAELVREFKEFKGKRPATSDELAKVVKNNTNSLPGQYEAASAVLNSLMSSSNYGRPYSYPTLLKAKYDAMTTKAINAQSKIIQPEKLTWIIVGDVDVIRKGVEALNLGPLEIWDADGNKVE
jgi:zinc protease